MEIKKNQVNAELTVALSGRLDTVTAPELEASLGDLADVEKLILDLAALEYVSSAGLRVLLSAQKKMSGKSMVIKNVNETIMEVFDITGFADILTIE